ncbi:Heat shock-like 85 kDa protein [Galdieria sulphuraria]|uniref:Molecular chaperone HtpG n=1 Tax=Galdieria sulphuraria TaxID=130081 RepID=M2XVF6_GALSU|nr:molecular chaperone HtpG [Galdieria sulphuraria]EME27643.1 molecular chaperone HtpG [Galdieria sulphuraria]GJD07466.1 Heat shock-like 85 kDa protein [Galdieria sulphuraria]|eukprot:XP_005704163.1 molecular chaperone HtpG [Galdieria sulphuraria]
MVKVSRLVFFILLFVTWFGYVRCKTDTQELFHRSSDSIHLQSSKDSVKNSEEESFEFRAEVQRLMNIIIHSLYSNKEIFFRELVSNSADALEKLRFLSLTNRTLLGDESVDNLKIQIDFDPENMTITIEDNGIGMTKQELINNLGVVARSGTLNFLEQLKDQKDSSLIGQFGVGFYAAYLVADKVSVISKSIYDKAYVWESNADKTFTVKEYVDQSIGRGTKVILHVRQDSTEFLSEHALRQLVDKYCRFITFPIYMKVESSVSDEETLEEEEEEEATLDSSQPKTKTQVKNVQLNEQKPTWLKDPSEVKEDEYKALFLSLSPYSKNYLTKTHFRAEGEIEFRSILFVPERLPFDFFSEESEGSPIKLYLKRVLVSDKFAKDALLPRWLSFVLGIVDSDDLPINISREMLQQSSIVQLIRKKLIQKSLEMIRNLATSDEVESSSSGHRGINSAKSSNYSQFWKQYGKYIKLGVIEDSEYRKKLVNLLRFQSSKTNEHDPNDYTSLKSYVARMKAGQDVIYYLAGESGASVRKSPLLEQLQAKNFEVLFLTEPIDEYLMQTLTEFESYKFIDVSKENLRLGDDEKAIRAKLSKAKKQFQPLIDHLEQTLSEHVTRVKVTSRLVNTPCMLVSAEGGYSANTERILRAQALANPEMFSFYSPKKVLEINPDHTIIKRMLQFVKKRKGKKEKDDISLMLYELAAISSGFQLDDISGFSQRMLKVISLMLDNEKVFAQDFSTINEEEIQDNHGGNRERNEEKEQTGDSLKNEIFDTVDHEEL